MCVRWKFLFSHNIFFEHIQDVHCAPLAYSVITAACMYNVERGATIAHTHTNITRLHIVQYFYPSTVITSTIVGIKSSGRNLPPLLKKGRDHIMLCVMSFNLRTPSVGAHIALYG